MTVTPVWTRSSSVLGICALALLVLGATGCGITSHSEDNDGETPRGVVPKIIQSALITGADTCAAATLSTESFDEAVAISDTTVGQTDDLDLPDADNPSCTAEPSCVGTGSPNNPRGKIWTGSGTGPDRAFRFQVSAAINLTATMFSMADLGLYLFSGSCMSQLSSCACVSDNAVGNHAEVISSIQAVPGVDYYLVVDGYLDPVLGGAASSGAFDLSIAETVIPVCGNDAIEGTEVCDDGNTDDCDGCRADCSAEETGCGDGFLCSGEECDDENQTSGDGCSATCAEEFTVDPSDAGTPAMDASTSNPSGGTSGNGGDGNDAGSSNGNEAGSGNGNDADSGSEAAGGNSGAGGSSGNQVKGGNRAGAGGTAGEANQPATAGESDESSGCMAANAPATSSSGWWVLAGLVSLSAARRRRTQPVLKLAALSSLAVACGLTQHNDAPQSKDALTVGQSVTPRAIQSALTGADTCAETELTGDALDGPLTIMGTTVGQADDVDLPDDMSGSSCTAAPLCVGTGNTVGGRGTAWAGCGTGPDTAYRFQVDSACTLSVTMLPDAADLGLYLFSGDCMSSLSSCACISDNAFAGMTETISEIQAEPGVDYYLLVDGYTQPPPATAAPTEGSYSLTITRTAGTCNLLGGCGNDSTDIGEACDDGNTESCDGCSADCSIEETGCGDGIQCGDEECDDGNTDNGDGCSATCREETTAPIDSGTADAATASTDSGASGAASGGQGGTTNEPDASVSAGGSGLSSTGKGGQVKGGGGTPPTDNQPAAPAASGDDDGGGCASAGGRSLPSSAWLTLCSLVSLAAMRRRVSAKHASARVT